MIFVDTSAWFARLVPTAPEHGEVRQWFVDAVEPQVTTDYIVDETLTLLVARGRHDVAKAAAHEFFDGSLAKLHYLTQSQIERAAILFRQKTAAGWSFTDCTCKIVIDDLQVSAALTLDRHFAEFGVSILP